MNTNEIFIKPSKFHACATTRVPKKATDTSRLPDKLRS